MPTATKWLVPSAVAFALALGLGACAVAQLEPGASLTPEPDTGLVILSVTRSGWRDFDLKVDLREVGSTLPQAIDIYARSRARDWKGGDGASAQPEAPEGRLFVLKLKPGTYRLDQWSGHSRSGGMSGDGYDLSTEAVGARFSVEPGTVKYFGSLHIRLPKELNYTANLMHATYHVDVEDQRARDLAVLRTKFPTAASANIPSELVRLAQPGRELRYFVYNLQVGSPNKKKL